MTTRHAVAEHEGHWWVVHVKGVGITQGRTVHEARSMATDLVSTVTGEDDPVVQVDFRVGDIDVTGEAARLKQLVVEAEVAQEAAGLEQRAVVRKLLSTGLTGSDVAAVLGVSPQRVSHLASR